jgi:hypothetical protein
MATVSKLKSAADLEWQARLDLTAAFPDQSARPALLAHPRQRTAAARRQ